MSEPGNNKTKELSSGVRLPKLGLCQNARII
jgi:hypothetical protein